MKKKKFSTLVVLFFGAFLLHSQTEFGLTAGVVMTDNGTNQTSAYPGATLSLGIFHKKGGIGARFRKDFGYNFDYTDPGIPQLSPQRVQLYYYAENFIELFKTFRFPSKKPYKQPQFTIGTGYGRVSANSPTSKPTHMLSLFASMPVHWFAVEFRVRPLLTDVYSGPAIGGINYARPSHQLISIALHATFKDQLGGGNIDSRPQRERKMQYPLTVGLVFNDNLSTPFPGATFSFGAFHKKSGIGIRYRKDAWYDFLKDEKEVDAIRYSPYVGVQQQEFNIQYYEENYVELYKTFRFKSAKPNWSPQFTMGGGYGQIYPYFPYRAARVASVFFSIPVKWVVLEARARPFLHNPTQHPQRIGWGTATPQYQWFSFSIQTVFPRKYFQR